MDPSLNISPVGETETTYVSVTNQPTTNIPPTSYLSIRITLSHSQIDKLQEAILVDLSFIAYPHLGKDKSNPHWHLLIPTTDSKTLAEKIRQRVKRTFPTQSGNKFFSIKQMANGLLQGIQYCSHEGTQPVHTDDMLVFIQQAPRWVQTHIEEHVQVSDKAKSEWQLTYSNLVPQALMYARKNHLHTSLKETVHHMIDHTNWSPSIQLVRNGVPEYYERRFEQKLGRRDRNVMDWWIPQAR